MKSLLGPCFLCLILLLSFEPRLNALNDLTVVSHINYADGLGRISIGLIDLLKNDLKINCISSFIQESDLSEDVKAIVYNPDKTAGTVSILFNPLWHYNNRMYEQVPKDTIRIAYSMLECSEIPSQWVRILNQQFDAVVVPDPFLVSVYENSGVTIPIFELPIGMNLDQYFNTPKRVRPSKPFVFGTTVSCDDRKNCPLLIEAFAEEFGDCEDVILKLNSRFGNVKKCRDLIDFLGVKNVILTHKVLKNEAFINFLNSFDCFVNLSKGEGFSLCPREALALGIPCILTRNTAQITLCDSGFVREVLSEIEEPADYGIIFGNQILGNFFNCSKEDVRRALRDVYENYSYYWQQAEKSYHWLQQYQWKNLKRKYMSLIKPKRVLLGDRNIVGDEYLMTNSKKLKETYEKAFNLKD